MRYTSSAAFRSALEQRLRNESDRIGVPVVRLRKAIVFDRLLARLFSVAPDRWVLKGALALDYRFGPSTRPTMDVDLARTSAPALLDDDMIAAQNVDLEDHFRFSIEKTERPERPVASISYRARVELGGRPFDTVLIDVGLSDPILGEPEQGRSIRLLDFAGIEPATVSLLPLEQHVAEKLHAYTRIYGSGIPSSRVKDIVDLVTIASSASLDALRLRGSIVEIFGRRELQGVPAHLPEPPREWKTPYAVLAENAGIAPEMVVGFQKVAALLDPILDGTARGTWNPSLMNWTHAEEV